ncbi:S-layer homology domain-containing protein [Paenibacillus sepulcri]|uniref:S-layer homology domain-containing protein n=1 Tax=Paenibacillus sepulcri TaxID=359917 RepID=A0ABS7BWI5_9BACL|nr:S-layer homology domain-containing protein [Paenibacillus sepulcri]
MVKSKSFKQAYHIVMAVLLIFTGFNNPLSTKVNAAPVVDNGPLPGSSSKAVTLSNVYPLKDNWKIQSATKATYGTTVIQAAYGGNISTTGYDTSGWYDTQVPSTVLGALVNDGSVPGIPADPYIGDGMSKIDEEQFKVPWWYRTDFTLPQSEQGKRIIVNFQGIAYKGNIWVNGHQIADSSNIVGSFRTYELDITDYVTADGVTKNTLAVSVERSDYGKDFSIYWVDWVPRPADNNMGLWRDVFITTTDSVEVRNPYVGSKVNNELNLASLNAYVDLSNKTSSEIEGTLSATITDPGGAPVAAVSQPVTLGAGVEDQEFNFGSDKYAELNIANPQLWWPKDMGGQPMYSIEFKFTSNNVVTDVIKQKFGIREINTEMNVSPSDENSLKDMVQFYVNHKPILIKAGGYSPTDLLLRRNQENNVAIMQYIDDMGLNAIRDEGMFFDDRLLDLLDEKGILYMTGWVCCSRWQQPAAYSDAELDIVKDSLQAQIQNARVHPSMIAWLNGSDNPPSYGDDLPNGGTIERGKQVEQAFLDLEHKIHWDEYGAIISSGSAKKAELTGTYSGMHMDATYDYAPPAMYFEDMNDGGAFGFTSEAGPGPSIPVIETMKKILPANTLWPYNVGGDNFAQWNYHTARGSFKDLANFNRALDNHYGESNSLEEFNIKAQVQQYDAFRAQYEALQVNKYTNASGWVQWMLNNAWPSLYWNMFDYYLNPNSSYFGTKIANEPLHILFDYGTKQVKIVNSTQTAYSGLNAKVQIYNIDSKKVYDKTFNQLAVTPDGAAPAEGGAPKTVGYQDIDFGGKINEAYGITTVDQIDEADFTLSPTYFIRLELRDDAGNLVSVNSYAESLKKDVVKYSSHNWNATPQNQYADYTDLQKLGPAELSIAGTPAAVTNGAEETLTYTIKNDGSNIAYSVFAKIRKGEGGDLVAPVRMDDNYFMLLPGEERTLTAQYKVSDLGNAAPVVEISSYNNIVVPQKGLPTSTNLVFKKTTATASTTQGSNNANNALDSSSLTTKWQSSTNAATGADPQWYKVDLGAPTTFSRAVMRWDYANYAQNLTVEVSDDNTNWKKVLIATNSNGSAMNDLQFAPVTKRYIRVTMEGKRPGSPQIGSGGTGQGVTGLAATNPATSFNLAAFELYGPAATLTGDASATTGSTYSLDLGLQNVTSSVFGEDVNVNYDSTKFDFVSAVSAEKTVSVSKVDKSVPGTVKLKLAASGPRTSLSDTIVKLQFKAKDVASIDNGNAEFTLTGASLSFPSPSLVSAPEVKNQAVKLVLRDSAEVQNAKAEYDGEGKQLKVTWKDPDDIVFSKVKITVDTPANIEPVIVDKGVQSFVLGGLNSGDSYSLRISALNGNGSASEGIVLSNKVASPVTGIVIKADGDGTSIMSYQGTLQLTAEVTPSYASDPSVTWSVSGMGGSASISETGLLTAAGDGDVLVKAAANDGSGVVGELKIAISGQNTSIPYYPAPPVSTPGTDGKESQQSFSKEELAHVQDGKVKLELKDGKTEAVLPINAGELLAGNALEVQASGVTLTIPAAVIQKLAGQLEGQSDKAQIIVRMNPEEKGQVDSGYKLGGSSYNLELVLVDQDGKESKLASLTEQAEIVLSYPSDLDEALLGVYTFNETTGKWDYVGGDIDITNDTAAVKVSHLGTYAVMQYDKTFIDVPSKHWVYRSLQILSAKHLINGVSDTQFKPSALTTRAEFAALLVRAIGLDATGSSTAFADVTASDWFAADVAAAFDAGLIQGLSDTEFAPNATITREQMAVLIVRAYEYKNGKKQMDASSLADFKDHNQVSSWAEADISKALELELMRGQSAANFAPKSNTTRAEAAQALLNLIDLMVAE